MEAYLTRAQETIPAEVRMISGCKDEQTSADVSNVNSFQLPDPAGKAGGACTAALLKVLYADRTKPDADLSFQEVLLKMRDVLAAGQYSQVPQLSASRPLNVAHKFDLVPDNFSGTKRAVLIGINYVGDSPGELSGCHNDVLNMKEYIMDVHGFPEENITVLMDDGVHTRPTRDNMLAAYADITKSAQSGDAVFCHYSGHGGKLVDDDGDEEDGFDETLIPVDYKTAGQIRDDDLFKCLVGAFDAGVTVTCIMDCCHSGTVLDLPYEFRGDGSQTEMTPPAGFNYNKLLQLAHAAANAGLLGKNGKQNVQKLENAAQMAAQCGGCAIM